MRKFGLIALASATALTVSACGGSGSGGGENRDFLRVVGSSTVYPFATAVSEATAKANPDMKSPVIESTWRSAYQPAHRNCAIKAQPVGSPIAGCGIKRAFSRLFA